MKDVQLSVRFTAAQHKMLLAAAKKHQCTVADVIRAVLFPAPKLEAK